MSTPTAQPVTTEFNENASHLLIDKGPAAGKRLFLKLATVLGSHRDCDVRLPADNVGELHCILFQNGEGWWVRHCDPKRTTLINGSAVTEQPLHDGDTLQIGKYTFTAVLPAGGAASHDEGIRALEKEIAQLRIDLAAARSAGAAPPVDIEETRKALAAERQRVQDFIEQEMAQLQRAKDAHAQEVKSLQALLAAQSNQQQELMQRAASLSAAESHFVKLKANHEKDYQERLRAAEETLSARQNELDDLIEQCRKLRVECQERREELEQLTPQIPKLQEELGQLQASIEAKRAEVAETARQLETLRAAVAEATARRDELAAWMAQWRHHAEAVTAGLRDSLHNLGDAMRRWSAESAS